MHDDSMIDSLDREIAQALAVDPSPEFVARVRARVAGERPPHAWTWSWLLVPVGALAAAALVLLAVPHRTPPAVVRPLDARQSASIAPLPHILPSQIASGLSRTAPTWRERPVLRRDAPAILIDAREAEALRSLMAGVRAGTIDLAPALRASKPAVMELEPITLIDIPGITFEPLAQGVQQ